jgi:hypothetical protein
MKLKEMKSCCKVFYVRHLKSDLDSDESFLCTYVHTYVCGMYIQRLPWLRGLVVSSPAATEETGAMGREVESLQGIGW